MRRLVVVAALATGLAGAAAGRAQFAPPARQPARPKLEAVAETSLLMNGLAQANLSGLGRSLANRPADAQAWTFARGQALIVAETGNLLMLRPPRTGGGQDAWLERATELRESAARLARSAAAQDYDGAKLGLVAVTNACNRCHQSFRVPVQASPFGEPGAGQK